MRMPFAPRFQGEASKNWDAGEKRKFRAAARYIDMSVQVTPSASPGLDRKYIASLFRLPFCWMFLIFFFMAGCTWKARATNRAVPLPAARRRMANDA